MSERPDIVDIVDRVGRMAHAIQFAQGLNPAQWEALRYLSRANRYSRTPGALADYLGITKGTASQTLIALEARGFIVRHRSKTDRRSVDVDLTEQGRDLVRRDPLDLIRQAAAAMTVEDCETIARAMALLMKSLERARGMPEFGRCGDCVHNLSDGAFGESCRCALTSEFLMPEELSHICVNFDAPTDADPH